MELNRADRAHRQHAMHPEPGKPLQKSPIRLRPWTRRSSADMRRTRLRAFTVSLVLLLQITPISTSSATTIVILKTSSQIVAGADSMGLFLTGTKRISSGFCKIHQVHDFFIASGGLYDTRAGQRLNINEMVKSVARRGEPLAAAVNRFSRAIVKALSQVLAETSNDEALHEQLMRANIVTFFFGFENGRPAVYMDRAVINAGERPSAPWIESVQESCGASCVPPDGRPYLLHTPSAAIDDFRASNAALLQDDPVAFVRNAIAADITANSHRSGPPVDLLRLDRNGIKWIDKKPNCP